MMKKGDKKQLQYQQYHVANQHSQPGFLAQDQQKKQGYQPYTADPDDGKEWKR
jgi:hypothetical protein